MADNVSLRIVDFLSKLPQFDDDTFNGKEVARRITDGTVFMAPESQELYEDGLLTVYWQGDSQRCSNLIIGQSIAAMEIAEGVRLWVAMGEYPDFKTGYMHLAQHFAFKTGTAIHCGYEVDNELFTFLGNVTRKIGSQALISLIKAARVITKSGVQPDLKRGGALC
jgi:hypothetical protein